MGLKLEFLNLDSPQEKTLIKVLPQDGLPPRFWGFVFDGASHPLRFLFSPPYDTLGAQLFHDYAYTFGTCKRKTADLYLLARLRKLGWTQRAFLWYYAVRLFGRLFYQKRRKLKINYQ